MSTLARQGYDLIIGVGFAQGDAIAKAAKKFPKTKFAIVDVDQATLKGKPANVEGLLFREQEVGYLAGYLAALEAKSAGGNRSAPSEASRSRRSTATSPATRRARRRRCRASSSSGATRRTGTTRRSARSSALNQIAAGSKVVFQVAGGCGLGALLAAKEQNVWGIGVDADQSFLGPHVLTSALKGVDSAVFLTSKSVQDGMFKGGGNAVFGLEQDGVGLGKFSPKANKADIAATKKIEQQIADGTIPDIPTTVG